MNETTFTIDRAAENTQFSGSWTSRNLDAVIYRAGACCRILLEKVLGWLRRGIGSPQHRNRLKHGFPDVLPLEEKHRLGLYERM